MRAAAARDSAQCPCPPPRSAGTAIFAQSEPHVHRGRPGQTTAAPWLRWVYTFQSRGRGSGHPVSGVLSRWPWSAALSNEQLHENLCLAMLEVLRRGQQGHRPGPSLITQMVQRLGPFRFSQLGFVTALELGKLGGLMAVPTAQLI